MGQRILAWIEPLDPGAHPEHPIVNPPPQFPGQPPSGAHPEHPIFYPPGTQPHPEHPIVNPPPGGNVPGGPHPEHPIVIPPIPGIWPEPGKPTHPIVLPPHTPGQPEHPIYIEGHPEHPIVLPPDSPEVWPPLRCLNVPSTGPMLLLVQIVGTSKVIWVKLNNSQSAPPTTGTTAPPGTGPGSVPPA